MQRGSQISPGPGKSQQISPSGQLDAPQALGPPSDGTRSSISLDPLSIQNCSTLTSQPRRTLQKLELPEREMERCIS
jgi:hypothetical protein